MDAEQERARRNALRVIDERLRAFHSQLTKLPIDRFVKLLDQHDPLRATSRTSNPNTAGEPNGG